MGALRRPLTVERHIQADSIAGPAVVVVVVVVPVPAPLSVPVLVRVRAAWRVASGGRPGPGTATLLDLPDSPRRSAIAGDQTLSERNELAFAYSNPTGLPYLMIFGVDEHRHVYWFHPGWARGTPPPAAVRAAPGVGPHELADAVHHDFDGRSLAVYLVSSRQPLDAQFIEDAIRRAPDLNAPQVFGPGAIWSRRSFVVTRASP